MKLILIITISTVLLIGCNRGTFTDKRDGKSYKFVRIGEQTWMAENLNFDYASLYTSRGSWVYDNIPSNANIYGRLYDWETACDICPDGWHLPSDKEWNELEEHLGLDRANHVGWRGTDQGRQLAGNESLWAGKDLLELQSGFGKSGFMALPGGWRSGDDYEGLGKRAYFWTTWEDSELHAWYHSLSFHTPQVNRNSVYKSYGLSVRCIKDN